MNKHKMNCILLIILTFVFSCYTLSAYATEITPEQVEKILQQQSAENAKNSSSPAPEASSEDNLNPTSSSGNTNSPNSRRNIKQNESEISSSGISSEISSEVSSEIVLPSVASVEENNPLSSPLVDKTADQKMKWIGIASWVCIILGVVVVLLVVFSNRRPPRGGPGRKRYHKPKRSKKKRLLNDKYYRDFRY